MYPDDPSTARPQRRSPKLPCIRAWSRSPIDRSSIHSRSGSGSSTGRILRRSSALDKSLGRHTNRLACDSAPVPLRSVRVTGSQAKNHIRASDASDDALPARAQQKPPWLPAAKLQSRSDQRNFATLWAVLFRWFDHHTTHGGFANRLRSAADDERVSTNCPI
jgi:hypothetical protein